MSDPDLGTTCPMCGTTVSKAESHCPGCGERLRRPDSRYFTVAEQMLVRRFRAQCRWLGGMWIFLGVICAIAGLLIISGNLIDWEHSSREFGLHALLILCMPLSLTGVVMMTLGFYCRGRKEIGVYLSPAFCYLALAGSLLLQNVCVLPVAVVFLIQSHIVLRTAGRMKQTGIPLDSQ